MLLTRAAEWRTRHADIVFSEQVLKQLTAVEGIDFATALLYNDVINSSRYGSFIKQIDRLRDEPAVNNRRINALLAIAPGAFYKEYPQSGADGPLLRQQAEILHCPCELIPSPSMGGIAENGRAICDWLATRPERRIILASISKGGSDIKAALARPEAATSFQRVVAWINLGGMLDGSAAVEWILQNRLRRLAYRSLFWWRGLRLEVFTDLRRAAGTPLDFPLSIPERLLAIHVVGFPLRNHLCNRLSRTCHARVAPLGPNDGAILLSDVLRMPGLVYPVWGADHYLRPSWELRKLAAALLRYVAGELNL